MASKDELILIEKNKNDGKVPVPTGPGQRDNPAQADAGGKLIHSSNPRDQPCTPGPGQPTLPLMTSKKEFFKITMPAVDSPRMKQCQHLLADMMPELVSTAASFFSLEIVTPKVVPAAKRVEVPPTLTQAHATLFASDAPPQQ